MSCYADAVSGVPASPSAPAPAAQPASPRARRALAVGRAAMAAEAAAVASVGAQLGDDFVGAVALLGRCRGHVAVVGVGKSGHVGRKISATLASVGAPSFFVDATEAVHGDLGRLTRRDVLLALSNSGETAELLQALPGMRGRSAGLLAITASAKSTLGRAADVVLATGELVEAGPLHLVPTVSCAVAMALGDALAMALLAARSAPAATYAERHPGGTLGQRLRRVAEVMRTGAELPVVHEGDALRHTLRVMTETPGRPGAACVVDAAGRLVGLFTDGDLRRLAQQGRLCPEAPIGEAMHRAPRCIGAEARLYEAAALLQALSVDQVPVVDGEGRPVGLLDVQDVLRGSP